ncbi:putative S-acyltransferase [Corchorus capsularis]|uniref:protein S-acyltransferase n=1 Tax=Corchorus capsularis TaxID=210143 RepID=A0A1R3IZJ4_COCAP|nr:putative S-acyltransferase [Corchorus capsularis]
MPRQFVIRHGRGWIIFIRIFVGCPPPPDLADEANHGDGFIRTYKAWKGSNVFLLGGRFIFGPDVRSLFLTIFLIAAPVAVFCVFVARKLMDDFPHHWGVSIMAIVVALTLCDIIFLLLTSGRDPGIIPRNTHPPEPEGYEGGYEVRPGQTPPLRLPRTKDVLVNDLTTTALGLASVLDWRIMDGEKTTIWKAIANTPASIVLVVYTFIAFWFVGGLTVFHLYLISTNQSTYENFRYRYDRRENPYNRGVIKNLMEVFCTSIPPSKSNFREKIPREPAIPPRTVHGGFISPNKGKVDGDIEMGSKPVWNEALGEMSDYERQFSSDSLDKDNGLPDVSPDLSRILPPENTEGRGVMNHPRRSSWGRNSERWEISPEILPLSRMGESKRMNERSNADSTYGNQQLETKF